MFLRPSGHLMAEPNLRRSELPQTLHWPRLNNGRFAAWAGPAGAKLRPGPRADGRIGPKCSSGPAPSRRMRRRGKGRGPPRMRPQLGLGQWGAVEGVHEEKLEGTPASPSLQPSWLPHRAPTHPSDPSPVPRVAWGWGWHCRAEAETLGGPRPGQLFSSPEARLSCTSGCPSGVQVHL